MSNQPENNRLVDIILDGDSFSRSRPDIEHERAVAIFDILEENSFALNGHTQGGPYKLVLSVVEKRLIMNVAREDDEPVITHALSLSPYKKIIKDYFLICESYYDAIKSLSPAQIEAIDMGRRGIHNEGSQILLDRLAGKIEIDFVTARRLFTLICILHWRG
ncbi:MAG: UPF0262 family protein [Nitratireductor sp.]